MPVELDSGGPLIELDEEIEGEEIGSRNYRYSKIGESVPILKSAGATSQFDPQSLPPQPLAVSERFRLLFLAQPDGRGFYVARTKDVMASAEAIKDKKAAQSIQELSLVDVPIGKISIMALSPDDSLLAATVSCHIHFFAVSALLHKEEKPSYSVSLDDSVCIKDMRWARKDAKAYFILSTDGKLYRGSGQGPLTFLMEDVDSADWSTRGNYIAVAKNNVVSILSSHFKEKLSFLLSFQSVIGDADASQVIKVDSIRWFRPDCIAVGCFQLNDDGEKENYIVQLITSRGRITDASSKPVILSFNNIFMDFCSDAVPNLTGPHLFLSYLDMYGLAFVANRNLSQKVALLCWPQDSEKNDAAMVEILDDVWNLYIDSQDDGEENVILGVAVDKASQNENLSFTLGDEEREVSPCCVIVCLTIDGKISVFHFASAAGALASAVECASSEEDDASHESAKHELPVNSSACGAESRELASTFQSHSEIEVEKRSAKATLSPSTNIDIRPQEQNTVENMGSQIQKVNDPKKAFTMVLSELNNLAHRSLSDKEPGKGFFGKVVDDVSCHSVSNYSASAPNVEPKMLPTTSPSTRHASRSNASVDGSKIPDKVDNSDKGVLQSSTSILKNSTELKEKPAMTGTPFGLSFMSTQGNTNALSAYPQLPSGSTSASGKGFQHESRNERNVSPSPFSLTHNNFSSVKAFQSEPKTAPTSPPMSMQSSFPSKKVFQSESTKDLNAHPVPTLQTQFVQNASKQFGNVSEMAKKLDSLLEGIERKGGFRDASITSQTRYVTDLEEGIWALSDKCGMWRGLLNEKLEESQVLLEKTIEVLARKIYMEGLFKQTTDKDYWEFWNCKKLSSELELKQRRILELNQELTNKLIELERHFNTLELNKFRENQGPQSDRRGLHNRQGHSRQIQSLQSVHNTITAQLSAAEQLSECLSNQMATLCIESSGKHDVRKQLFESIGLTYAGDNERSPARNSASIIPVNKGYSASDSIGAKEQTRRNQFSYAKGSEPQTARRHRDSLDRSWVNLDPPKSTVKRVLKEDSEKGSPNASWSNINKQYHRPQKKSEAVSSELSSTSGAFLNRHKSTEYATSAEQFRDNPISLFQATPEVQECEIPLPSTKSPSTWLSPPISQTRRSSNSELDAFRLGDDKAKGSLPSTGRNYALVANESTFVQQSDTSFRPLTKMYEQLPAQSLTSPFGSTRNRDHLKETDKDPKSTNHVSETLDSKFPAAFPSAFSLAPNQSEKSLFSTNFKKPSSPDDGKSPFNAQQSVSGSASASPLSNNYPSPLSPVSKQSSSTLFPATHFHSEAKEDVLQRQASAGSAVTLPSTLPSFGSNAASISSSSIISPEPSLATHGSKSGVQTKVDTSPSNSEAGSKIQTSNLQPALETSTSDLKLGTSVSSAPTDLPTNSKSDSRDGMSEPSEKISVTPPVMSEMPCTTEASSTVASSGEGINGSMIGAVSNSSHEEEMEEEGPETDQTSDITFANLDRFGIGTTQNSTTPKANPFGVSVFNKDSSFTTSTNMMTASTGELFRPASFNFQPSQPLQPIALNSSGGFSSGAAGQAPATGGFGQPAHVGAGQQALGSVLGSFGQSRQLGTGLPGSNVGFGNVGSSFGNAGFTSAPPGGGFGSVAAVGGGFAAAASAPGGFAAAATTARGGFGFAAAAPSGGGFAAAATNAGGGGFMSSATAMSGGGFGAFSNQPGSVGGSGTGRPTSELFTQMRK